MTPTPSLPSGEAMADLAKTVESVMLHPDEELRGIVVLAVALPPEGRTVCRLVTVPEEEHEYLIQIVRNYLAGPDDLTEYRSP